MNLSPKAHPNAYAASTTGSLATLLIWAEGFWVVVPPEIAIAQATLMIAAVLGAARLLGSKRA